MSINRFRILTFFVLFFHVVCKISILMIEPQSIWRNLLILSWLYNKQPLEFTFWECISWNASFAPNTKVDMSRNTQTIIVDHSIWHNSLNGLKQSPFSDFHLGNWTLLKRYIFGKSNVHIFWEGHKILQDLFLTFDCMWWSQK